ncbi:anthranilate synthase component I family protein [Marvinbryantia formatexigens]|nr:anthranilate synthase component I family protein [Marvinbryantia formatexigens]UWO27004.1 anthranilate synthase component I family protein [Marvinbryantia formatexigens DSM 14469]
MYPALEKVKEIAASGNYRRIPVSRELYADRFTPMEVMRTLRAASRHCYLLESAENDQKWGRYSILGYEPVMEITCTDGNVRIRRNQTEEDAEEVTNNTAASGNATYRTVAAVGNAAHDVAATPGNITYSNAESEEFDILEEYTAAHPGKFIREILEKYKSPRIEGMPPFTGGMVGYFSYDYLKYAEPTLKLASAEGEDFRDMDLMLFTKALVFDHYRQKLVLITGVDTEDVEASYRKAETELADMASLLNSGAKAVFRPLKLKEELKPDFSRERYTRMVERAKHYIHEGDIFQVVLSNPQTAKAEGSLFDTYRVLRTSNPSPYMFYFSSDDVEIAGASPETLVKLENGKLYTFPLAGTRPRGKTEEEDLKLEEELLQDEKELAEHNMLVDLGRNDIGRISRPGSVKVEKYCSIERFSCVMHIGSTVSGQIREELDGLDAVDSILPAGTLSGAPKIRACQIIQELEGRKRGIYGGAVGYLDFTGNLDTCIGIRLVYKKNGKICVQSGAGIVADSVPEKEYQECCNKAKAMVQAVLTAQEGLE